MVKAGPLDTTYVGGEHADTDAEMVRAVAGRLGLEHVQILSGVFPDETGEQIEDREFRFCHIDVDVYESAHEVLAWLWPRLVDGGIVVFDDYGFRGCRGITQLVDEQRALKDRAVIHNLNGHGLLVKRAI